MTEKEAKLNDDIKDVAKELAMLEEDPTAEFTEQIEKVKAAAKEAKAKAEEKITKVKAKATEAAKKAQEKAMDTAEKAKKTAESAKATVEKAVKDAQAKRAVKQTAIVEFAGNQYNVEEVIARCEAKFKSENKKKSFSDIKVYIKPENNAAYYVVDGKSADKINLI